MLSSRPRSLYCW